MVVGITLSGLLEWNFPASLSAMVSYQILTLEKLTGAQGSSSSPHLSCTIAVTSSALFLPYLPLLSRKSYMIWMKKCSLVVSELPFFSLCLVLGIKYLPELCKNKISIVREGHEHVLTLPFLVILFYQEEILYIFQRKQVYFKRRIVFHWEEDHTTACDISLHKKSWRDLPIKSWTIKPQNGTVGCMFPK